MARVREGETIGGRYRLVRRLGEGGFGAVFEAEHVRLEGRRVAVKVLDPLLSGDAKLRRRFLREVDAASRLAHPNILLVREVDETPEGVLFCIMDLSPGEPLRALLAREGRLAPGRAVPLVAQLLDALAHAHERHVIHRDIKPENVLVERDAATGAEVVRVVDFGIAKVLENGDGPKTAMTTPGAAIGTYMYLSPEQAEGKPVDGRSDEYSAAVVLWELLAGELPFRSQSEVGYAVAHATRPAPRLLSVHGELARAVPPPLDAAVARALEKDPGARFPSCREFRRALLDAMASATVAVAAAGGGGGGGGGGDAGDEAPASVIILRGLEANGGVDPALGPEGTRILVPPDPTVPLVPRRPPAGTPSPAAASTPSVSPPSGVWAGGGLGAGSGSGSRGARTPLALPPGTVVGRYVLGAMLGGGGMGTVFSARHVHTQRVVALKVLHPDVARNETVRARFLREARVASRFRHPCVADVFDFDDVGGYCYLAMELAEGWSLREALVGEERLEPARVARIYDQLLDALAAAHEAGVIHRDLKPSNILVDADDRVKVLDFGIARILEPEGTGAGERLTRLGDFVGTPAYAAPEQIRGLAVDARTDLYQAGVMLFEVLAGRRPFVSESPEGYALLHVNERAPLLSSVLPGLERAAELDRVVGRALAKEPRDRFQTAREMREAVIPALGGARPLAGAHAAGAPGAVARAGAGGGAGTGTGAGASGVAPTILAPRGLGVGEPGAPARPLARAVLECRGVAGLTRVFIVAGRRLALGRSPEDARRGTRNDVILQVLPCRDETLDPENWAATLRISHAHGAIEVDDGGATYTDRSSRGTRIDGIAAPREAPVPLADRFELDVAGGALALEGRVVRGGPGPFRATLDGPTDPPVESPRGGPVQAVTLRRVSNAPEHLYVLVVQAVTLGLSRDVAVSLEAQDVAPAHARITHRSGGFWIEVPARPVRPLRLEGHEVLPGRPAPLVPGTRLSLGAAELTFREVDDQDFMEP